MNRTKLEDEINIATQVRRIKVSFLDKFFEEKEAQIFELFKATPIGSSDDLVEIHHQLKSLNALRVEIQSAMDTGKMAQMELDTMDK